MGLTPALSTCVLDLSGVVFSVFFFVTRVLLLRIFTWLGHRFCIVPNLRISLRLFGW